jgi:ABC-type molybdate transport system substrate-binding protein
VNGTSVLKIASAGSTLFGARKAAALYSASGAAPAIDIATDHGHLLYEQAMAGALDADIVMLPTDMIDELVARARAAKAGSVALGSVNIGAAVRTGAAPADVSDRGALADALLSASEIVLTLTPTGEHMMGVIGTLGLLPDVECKIRRFDKSAQVNAYIADAPSGALAFGPATEILAWCDKGIAWCGPIPDEFQVELPYTSAILASSQNRAAAQDFTAFLARADARAAFAETGVST